MLKWVCFSRARLPKPHSNTPTDKEKVPLHDVNTVSSPAEEKLLPQWRPDRVVTLSTTRDQVVTALCILTNTCATVAMVFLSKRSVLHTLSSSRRPEY